MINLPEHLQLKHMLNREDPAVGFPVGVELVSTRGTMSQGQSLRARRFAEDLTHSPRVQWVSITDNAGGNPQMAPVALGTPILYAGKEVVIHLTCKDLNRHALESDLWLLASQGFHNVLAMTGDYPALSVEGRAKPVFDIDSVALLAVISRMNAGLEVNHGQAGARRKLDSTYCYAGAVVNSFKPRENTLVPQYLKLEQKIRSGAQFIINQIGFDARKKHELIEYLRWRGLARVPLIGNVYVLSPGVAALFHQQKIPGITLSDALYAECEKQGRSPDQGRAFFREFAARQIAVYRGLGYAGIYLGGVHRYQEIEAILELERSFGPDDWKSFARYLRFAPPGEYYLFDEDEQTGLCRPQTVRADAGLAGGRQGLNRKVRPLYLLSKAMHRLLFARGGAGARAGAAWCRAARDPLQGPAVLRFLERKAKAVLYDCQDCGDCSLAETAFLCPESQCAKNQRNGPCGGTRDGRCEVFGYECIWARAYDRLRDEGRAADLLAHAPVIQDQGLRGTSAWASSWLGHDHQGRQRKKTNNSP